LVANGVDPDMFTPEKKGDNIKIKFSIEEKFIVTYSGALGIANDISTILKSASHLINEKDIHFIFAGDGKERKNLQKQAEHLNLTNVTFIGPQPKTIMPDILAASDACIAILKDISMFRTTYPNKVFDYMAAGRPTILAIDGVIREVIESAEGGVFVPPGDDIALADAVRRLCHDRERARSMGESARAYVVKHFNRHEQATHFAALTQRLAAMERRRR
jgi:glycosyltransferase involved in cell wall biosynthesis